MKNQDCSGKKRMFSSHPFDGRKEIKREGGREQESREREEHIHVNLLYCKFLYST